MKNKKFTKKEFDRREQLCTKKSATRLFYHAFKTNYINIIDLNDLRKKFGKRLSEAKCTEIELFIISFANMAYKKYADGAREHKNNLTVDVAKKELLQEAIDLFIYAMKVNSNN